VDTPDVRYKPGTNIVVDYDVRTRDGPRRAVLMVAADRDLARRAVRPANRALAAKVNREAGGPPPLAHLPEWSALVQWLPLDVWLPQLAEPASDLARAAGLDLDETGDLARLLAYKPRRRAVLGIDGHVLKLYADERDFAAAAAALLHGPRLPVPTAFPAGFDRSLRLTAQQRIHGTAVDDPAATAAAAAALLADLHRAPPPRGEHALLDPLVAATATAAAVAALVPPLAGRLDRLMGRLADTSPGLGAVTCHGDFHSRQLLVADHGLTVLDLDELAVGHPAADLATYAAHVHDGTPAGTELAGRVLDALTAGYGSRPPLLAWHLTAATLRRAVFPFRTYPTPDWPERVEAMIAYAERVMPR
jgi:hypothetical protein